jgi:hypothetical protein
MTGDPDLGYVYVPLDAPEYDWYGGERPGSNLFADALVCLDAKTGKRIWHHQLVHPNLWDYETPAAPILADLNVGGRRIKAVAQITKMGFTFVFDRVTGAPVWPIEERPVPKGNVPGEWYSPTQPFPTKPAPFDRTGISVDDLIDFTPELKAKALEIANQYEFGPIYTPPSIKSTEPGGKKGTLMVPGWIGGGNWDGAAPMNQVAGLDANLAFFQNVQINAYFAQTHTTGLAGDAASYRADFQYNGDRYGVEVDHLKIGDAFNPEIGYLRRRDARRNLGLLRFSPRPASLRGVRKLSYEISLDHIENGAGQLETAEAEGVFKAMLNNGDTATAQYLHHEESLRAPFEVGRDVVLPVGRYPFGEGILTYQLGPQRKISGAASLGTGRFYNGTRTGAAYQGRVELTKQLAVEPRVSVDRIDLPEGRFTATLVSGRTTYNLTPRMFVAALLQYNSGASSFGANIRFRWEYEPGSEFVVFGEGRDTASRWFPQLQNRSFVVKYTRLFRF